MSNALRRRLAALAQLTEQRGAMPGEAAAAALAIERIRARLKAIEQPVGWPDQSEPYHQDSQEQPGPSRRRARRKASHERPARHRLHISDVIDLDCTDHPAWGRCKCGSSTAQVTEGMPPIAVAWLMCSKCRRSRKLQREHFETGGRWRQA